MKTNNTDLKKNVHYITHKCHDDHEKSRSNIEDIINENTFYLMKMQFKLYTAVVQYGSRNLGSPASFPDNITERYATPKFE